jgi:hypothetical protein
MPGYPWKASDDAFLRKHFGKLTAAEIGKAINRSASSVYQRSAKLGLIQKRNPVEQKRRRDLIAKHAKQGLSDSEVAAIVGIERRTVGDIRTNLGIPANGRSERFRKRVAAKTREQCEKAGVRNLAELKSEKVRQLARKYGWPEDLALRSIQIAADTLKMQSTLRNAIFGAISEEDVVDIVKRQVEKAKQGDPTALQFIMKYALGFGQPNVVKTVNVLATDVETAARIAKAGG